MKKEAYYFSHDANARNDLKCLHLRKVLGWEGYGIFWALIEKLRDEPEHKIPLSNVPLIAFEFNISEEKINSVINMFDLFVIENDVFFSSRLLTSMDAYKSIKSRLSEAGKKGVEARLKGGLIKASTGFKQLKKRKGNKIKEKEIKLNENKINLIYPFDSKNFMNIWNILIKEPKWKKKSKNALQAALKKLSLVDEQIAIQMIENTIAGNWQGIFPINNNNNGQSTNQISGNKLFAEFAEAENRRRTNTTSKSNTDY